MSSNEDSPAGSGSRESETNSPQREPLSRPSASPNMLTDEDASVSDGDPASPNSNRSGVNTDPTVALAPPTTGDTSNDRRSPVLILTMFPEISSSDLASTSRQHNAGPANDEAQAGCSRRSSDGAEPPNKVRRVDSDGDLDAQTCPICLDTWANSGSHRIVSLKCGHIFGKSCVERWLQGKPARERCCPTCKTRATLRDVRHIYARRLIAADSSEITVLQQRVEQLQADKNRVELELQKTIISHKAVITQLEGLRTTLMGSRGTTEGVAAAAAAAAAANRRHWRFALEKNLQLHGEGGCRVLTYNCRTYELYASQKSSMSLFPGYGIRKVSCVDYTPGQYVHLHTKSIRDMTYSTQRDLLLSVSLDNTARVVERGIPTTTVHAGFPLWSCSWDYLRTNEFYVGGVGGQTLRYDIRNPATHLQRLVAESDLSPVASLASTEYGLLSCQLNSCWLWVSGVAGGSSAGGAATERCGFEPRAMPVDGPFMALTYDNGTSRALVACRPLAEGGRSRLSSCKLRSLTTVSEAVVDHEQTFPGSVRTTLMSRPAWVTAPGACWAAAHSESDGALYLHGLDGARTMSLPAADPAVDVLGVTLNGNTLLASLSERRLRIYKAMPANS